MVSYDLSEWDKNNPESLPAYMRRLGEGRGHSITWQEFVDALHKTPRTFRIYYPEVKAVGEVTVRMMPGELPEQAIRREGDVFRDEWIFMEEVR